jgi:hypothetical protein
MSETPAISRRQVLEIPNEGKLSNRAVDVNAKAIPDKLAILITLNKFAAR